MPALSKDANGPAEEPLAGNFSQRLFALRKRKSLSQSDLARMIWGVVTNKKGYEEARNRDRISAWEAGRAVPTRANLTVLADTLGVCLDDLAPDLILEKPNLASMPTKFSLVCLPNNNAHIRVDTVVTFDVATQIASLLAVKADIKQ